MALQNRYGKWHYRFKFNGQTYTKTTGLPATSQNMREANRKEQQHLQRLRDGRQTSREIVLRRLREMTHVCSPRMIHQACN